MIPIRLVFVGGIRTHYIKINAIQKAINRLDSSFKSNFEFIYINTAQHYDHALVNFIDELNIHFDYTLNHDSREPFIILSSIFSQLGTIFDTISKSTPIDYVVIMGDVSSTAVAALVATIKKIRLIHIEAGIRTNALGIPGNEEKYRIITDMLSSFCFASTLEDYNNLLNENIPNSYFSGDIVYDFIKHYTSNDKQKKSFNYYINCELHSFSSKEPYILCSLHHEENIVKENLQNLFNILKGQEYRSIFIAHPRIKKYIKYNNINTFDTIIADGIPYLENLYAIQHSAFCITDSGGIQREAFYFNKRCIVRSDLIIWQPIVSIGSNFTTGPSLDELSKAFKWAEDNKTKSFNNSLFGDGNAVMLILKTILSKNQ